MILARQRQTVTWPPATVMTTPMPTRLAQYPPDQSVGAAGLFAGLCVHTVVDGLALGAVLVSASAAVGLGRGGCISGDIARRWMHRLTETVMAAILTTPAIRRLEVAFAGLCPLVLWLFYFGAAPHLALDLWLPATLAFSAGAFICIALGDLLPEVQFHSHDRLRLTLLFLLGIGLAMALGWFEPAH